VTAPAQLEITLVSAGAGHTQVRVEVPDAPSKRGALPTSADAGHAIRHKAATLRDRVLVVLAPHRSERPWCGLTADEIAAIVQESPLAVRPRCSELHKAGLIVPTGARRRNASGLLATVWRVV
jgi:hypothetical protein